MVMGIQVNDDIHYDSIYVESLSNVSSCEPGFSRLF